MLLSMLFQTATRLKRTCLHGALILVNVMEGLELGTAQTYWRVTFRDSRQQNPNESSLLAMCRGHKKALRTKMKYKDIDPVQINVC